ncbi:MAG: AAA family ATPase [Candidatus Scalindua sp.]|jgi:replicative DNA helicase|nr:AAA family ATPase [Candidatus Scalindua sp.]
MIPHSEESEKAVIGAVLVDPVVFEEVEGWLRKPGIFYKNNNKIIWNRIRTMAKENKPLDQITIYEELRENNEIEKAGGGLYLSSLAEMTPSTANAQYYAKVVYQKYVQRQVLQTSAELQKMSEEGSFSDTSELLNKHARYINELQDLQPTRKVEIGDVLDTSFESIITSDDIIKFGIPELDDFAGGMTRGEITALGGRPSHGKTTLMINIVDSLLAQGLTVMVFNREMRNAAMIEKLVALRGDFKYSELRRKNFTESDVERLSKIKEQFKIKYKNLIMYDDVRDLDESIREIKRYKPDVVIDDYIQLTKVDINKKDRRFEVEEIMNEYKWVAKSLHLAVIAVSQLSREIEKRIDPKPKMSDFSESGSIEQVAETALFVFRGYVFNSDDYSEYAMELIVGKSRYGRVGTYEVGFNGNRCKFYRDEESARKAA